MQYERWELKAGLLAGPVGTDTSQLTHTLLQDND